MSEKPKEAGRVHDVSFSARSFKPKSATGDGRVFKAGLVAARRVNTVFREMLFLTGGTTLIGVVPMLRNDWALDGPESVVTGLFNEVYRRILNDPAFRFVSSAVPYCCVGTDQFQGHGFVYIPGESKRFASQPDPEKTPIVYLHGFGGNLLWNIWALKTEFPDRVILAPSGGICWPDNGRECIVQYLDDMRAYVEQEFGVKIERPWLIACSQGGPPGFTVASLASDRFRGFVSIASAAELSTELRYPAGFPILMINAMDDQRVSIRDAEASFEALEAGGANIELEWIEDADHFLLLTRREEVARLVRDFFNRSAKGVTRVNGNSNEKTKADARASTGVCWATPTSCEVVSWATAADFVGKYMWRTKGRTIEFDFHEGGTFEAEEKPDGVALSEGMGLVSKGKGIWMVLNGRLSVARTHVWMFMYWQKNPVTWIKDVKVVSVTRNGIRLESGNPLQRI